MVRMCGKLPTQPGPRRGAGSCSSRSPPRSRAWRQAEMRPRARSRCWSTPTPAFASRTSSGPGSDSSTSRTRQTSCGPRGRGRRSSPPCRRSSRRHGADCHPARTVSRPARSTATLPTTSSTASTRRKVNVFGRLPDTQISDGSARIRHVRCVRVPPVGRNGPLRCGYPRRRGRLRSRCIRRGEQDRRYTSRRRRAAPTR